MGVKLVSLSGSEFTASGRFVDVIDGSDPLVAFMEQRFLADSSSYGPGALKSDSRIVVYNKPSAVDYVVEEILQQTNDYGEVGLLRFHGHGHSGYQSICSSIMNSTINELEIRLGIKTYSQVESMVDTELTNPASRVAISKWNLSAIRPSLMRLRSVFSANAEVWLMGCFVGAGEPGWQLVNALAQTLGVTVKAGSGKQLAGAVSALAFQNFLHEGPIVTGSPG